MTAEVARFKFPNGNEMNGFWMYKILNEEEKWICSRLVRAGGPLGWNRRSINAAHIKMTKVENLISEGIIRKATLFRLAKELIGDKLSCEIKEELDREGGYLVIDKDERLFYKNFDIALNIVSCGETQEALEERYQIANHNLYDCIELLL